VQAASWQPIWFGTSQTAKGLACSKNALGRLEIAPTGHASSVGADFRIYRKRNEAERKQKKAEDVSKMIWCPYTDREIAETETNEEHILPLALGGSDEFVIRVDRSANCRVGSEIDGKIEKEFGVKFARREFKSKGHSGKEPEVHFNNARFDAQPAQVRFLGGDNVPLIRNPKTKSYVAPEKIVGSTIGLNFQINLMARFRFAAKVALSAGYFAFGDWFRRNVQHSEARSVMNIKTPPEWESAKPKAVVHDCYRELPQDDKVVGSTVMYLCNGLQASTVLLIPEPGALRVVVGVLSLYLASIIIPADISDYPKDPIYEMGHCCLIAERKLGRLSWRELLKQFYNQARPHCGSKLEGLPDSLD
jgi:hypothetical protein